MEHPAISVLTCNIAAYGIAIAIYPALLQRNAAGLVAVALACVAIPLCLFIIPKEQIVLRP